MQGELHRIAAFTDDPDGGNPAGVWIGDELPSAGTMQQIARDVGYSETAFLAPATGEHRTVRYYSPEAEVSFCGHATIAAGSVLGSNGDTASYLFETAVGAVPVRVRSVDGRAEVSLFVNATKQREATDEVVDAALHLLGWDRSDIDTNIQPTIAYAGAWHLVLAAANAERLAVLDYDFDGLKQLMLDLGLTTVQLVWRESDEVFHSRNPFPVGGVVEDPATGAAAAALGGYLRDAAYLAPPARFTIRQGEAMGQLSILNVEIPDASSVVVSGRAVAMRPKP